MTKEIKLSIFTGKPAFKNPLYVGKPLVEKEVRDSYYNHLSGIFDRNYFTNNGPLVQKLEAEVAQIHRVKYCMATCNATIGQMLVLKALNLEGEIILPSFTFIATAHACLWQNLKPVFCDINPESLTIDADKIEELITDKTCAIIGVHLFGNTCNVERLTEICRKHELKLIFDAAHAFNCSVGNTPIGRFGNAEILSFHATKFFSTFEGGAVLTNDPELGSRIRFLKNFGFRDYDDVRFLGINGKMPESSAAMGLASLQILKARAEKLKKNYAIYRKHLDSVPGIQVLSIGTKGLSNYHYIVILVNKEKLGISRDVLTDILWKENVIARRYFYPGCHRMEPYSTLYPDAYMRLPVTEDVTKRILCLPSNLENPEQDIPTTVNIMRTVHENKDKISKWAETHSKDACSNSTSNKIT